MTPTQVLQQARHQLDVALRMCRRHQPAFYGLCACNRVLPCQVKIDWGRQAIHTLRVMVAADDQLAALAEPTQTLDPTTGERRRIQHIAGPNRFYGMCGAPLDPNLAGIMANCDECWALFRAARKHEHIP